MCGALAGPRGWSPCGWAWETSAGGGSHFKLKRDGNNTVPVALGNGLQTEISDKLLKKIARQMGVSFEALRNG